MNRPISPAQPSKKKKKWAHVICSHGVSYATCKDNLSEAWVTFASGRVAQFPKLGKAHKRSDIALKAWLREQAMIEATNAKDDYCLSLFTQVDPKNCPPSQLDDLNDYLFDPKLKRVPNGLLVCTAPLSAMV